MIRLLLFLIFNLFCNISLSTLDGEYIAKEERAVIHYEDHLMADDYKSNDIFDSDILTISKLKVKDHSDRHSSNAFKRKNTNSNNHIQEKNPKSNLTAKKNSANHKKQIFVDQSFLKYLRISKMLC